MEYEPEDQEYAQRAEEAKPSEGLPWNAVVGTLVLVLVVVFAVQNTDSVEVRFLWMSGTAPVAIVITISAVGAVLFSALGGRYLRRRKLRRREEREALRRMSDES